MRAVHQFLPTWEPGAIGTHACFVRDLLRQQGLASEVFTYESRPGLPAVARPYRDYGRAVPAAPGDVLVYHLGIGSEIADFLLDRAETLVVDYHNITPAEIFEPWDPVVGENLEWGREQLARLARRAALGLADSAYNEAELRAAGYRTTAVAPILADLDARAPAGDAPPRSRARTSGTSWLFVGRVAPNKAQHEIVKAFAVYRRVYDPAARLVLVGGAAPASYSRALRRFVGETGLRGAIEITGAVDDDELVARYRDADVFVCLSEHEGFCLPLLEAMRHGVPVVARAAAAVPETVGDAALLVERRAPALAAAAVHRVLADDGLRAGLVAAGRRRVDRFSVERGRELMLGALTPLLEAA